ncbi:Homocysteine S-methyltransferase [Laetiporus sulphureus 93-53]|uniref:Homocysteine S-methyltransferase n=1 Tax=Laetiporus sulphureus 93-53 TaxID=1314785 RepID=A0A165D793_9APHY|nr:Homocysteine S-methyltransferase [Laetiporus sulphureus 93-53]KZT04271.1 Homocysteine S-methyltransferase [Laetiporus sulphureus 93-53]
METSESIGKDAHVLQVLVLDGGFGTTLEDMFHQNISTPLWSAKPIEDNPALIIETHLAFLRAGADVILTSTYQCAFSTFERCGYGKDDAKRIMCKAIKLAAEARRRFVNEQADSGAWATARRINIALSLGPFGATLSPAQEFDGFYPPPYGPRGYSEDGKNCNAFQDTQEGRRLEEEAIDALTAFHLERLRVFTEDRDVWDLIDFIAFETVPLTREVKAIRRAVGMLQNETGVAEMKPWWIGTVYPGGRFPEERTQGGERLRACDVAEAALGQKGRIQTPHPWGLGINCTEPKYLGGLLQEMTSAVGHILNGKQKPWLVVYPNRGDAYDPATQTWSTGEPPAVGEGWARRLCEMAQPILKQEVWHGVIVGGCCKTGPAEIAALAREARKEHLGIDEA